MKEFKPYTQKDKKGEISDTRSATPILFLDISFSVKKIVLSFNVAMILSVMKGVFTFRLKRKKSRS